MNEAKSDVLSAFDSEAQDQDPTHDSVSVIIVPQ